MPQATAVNVQAVPTPQLSDYDHPDGTRLDLWFAANHTTPGEYLITVTTATGLVWITATV